MFHPRLRIHFRLLPQNVYRSLIQYDQKVASIIFPTNNLTNPILHRDEFASNFCHLTLVDVVENRKVGLHVCNYFAGFVFFAIGYGFLADSKYVTAFVLFGQTLLMLAEVRLDVDGARGERLCDHFLSVVDRLKFVGHTVLQRLC